MKNRKKSAKRTPTPLYIMNPLSRNSGSAPELKPNIVLDFSQPSQVESTAFDVSSNSVSQNCACCTQIQYVLSVENLYTQALLTCVNPYLHVFTL